MEQVIKEQLAVGIIRWGGVHITVKQEGNGIVTYMLHPARNEKELRKGMENGDKWFNCEMPCIQKDKLVLFGLILLPLSVFRVTATSYFHKDIYILKKKEKKKDMVSIMWQSEIITIIAVGGC